MRIGTLNVLFWEFACGEPQMGAPPEEIRPVEVLPIGRGYAYLRADSRCRNGAKHVEAGGKVEKEGGGYRSNMQSP